MKPTKAYWDIIEDGKRHHRTSKTWTGGLAVRHCERIKSFIDRIGAKSVLDYGCGKGVQYTHFFDGKPLEKFWGVPVTKYDPAVPPDWKEGKQPWQKKLAHIDVEVLRELPQGQTWDLLVCTHVLGCIPVEDLEGWVVPLFHKVITKGMYFAENLAPATKKVVRDADSKRALMRDWTPHDWIRAVTPPDGSLEVEFWFRGHNNRKKFEKYPFNANPD